MLVPPTGVHDTVIQKVTIRIVTSNLTRFNIFRQIIQTLNVARSVIEKEDDLQIYSE
jgi:hypothetical protein